MNLTAGPAAPSNPLHPSLPPKPGFAQNADTMGFGAPAPSDTAAATQALGGSNSDVVANRAAIRMANMNARDVLKAELAGGLVALKPTKSSLAPSSPQKPEPANSVPLSNSMDEDVPGFGSASAGVKQEDSSTAITSGNTSPTTMKKEEPLDDQPRKLEPGNPTVLSNSMDKDVPGFGSTSAGIKQEDTSAAKTSGDTSSATVKKEEHLDDQPQKPAPSEGAEPQEQGSSDSPMEGVESSSPRGHKRKLEEVKQEDEAANEAEGDGDVTFKDDDDVPPEVEGTLPMKVKPDGTVDQPDNVR